MNLHYFRERKLALYVSLLYVGLSTLTVCSLYPNDRLYGEWTTYTLLFTFPISIFSFMFRYAEADLIYPVFIIQAIHIIPTFLFCNYIFKKPPTKYKAN